jgi:hypothetical protein
MKTILLLVAMMASPTVAQSTDYRTLWQRGAYAEAIDALDSHFGR